jgi:cold shock protein
MPQDGAEYYRPEYRRDYEDRGPQLRLDFGRGPTAGAPKSLAAKPPIRISAGSSVGRSTMARGTVKWFNPTKGYGFIQPQAGGKDVFVHISAVERAGLSTLNEGQQIEYEIEENRGKTSAVNLKVK